MVKYIIKDMIEVFQYLPYGIIAGIIMAIILATMNKKKKIPIASITCFVMYFVIMLVITFFSRENGSRNGVALKLFSTWGIIARNI